MITKRQIANLCQLRKETCFPQASTGIYVGLEHIDPGRFLLTRHGEPSEVRNSKSRFYPGDVLYGKLRPYLDKAVVAQCEGICSTDILVLKPYDAPSWYLCGLLHTDRFIEHAKQTTHGVNHPRTSWKGINVFETVALGVPEQKKIAAVLLKLQQAISAQDKMIQSLRDLKKSTMHFVFSRGLRGEKTKSTPIGEIPESWDVVSVEKAVSAFRFPRDKQIPASLYKTKGKYPIVDQAQGLISAYTDDENALLHASCPLIVFGDHTRSVKYIDFEFALGGDGTKPLTASEGFDALFLFYALSRLNIPSRGYNRHYKLLAQSLIPKPVVNEEQQEIAVLIRSLDQTILHHESKKSALQDLFKTTLNKLMTGDIRVADLDIDVKEVDG